MTRIRCSAHNLFTETGRHQNIARNDRICKHCIHRNIENEYHFILTCPIYRDLRLKYLPKFAYSWANIQKMVKLFSSQKRKHCINLSNYIFAATKLRDELQTWTTYVLITYCCFSHMYICTDYVLFHVCFLSVMKCYEHVCALSFK